MIADIRRMLEHYGFTGEDLTRARLDFRVQLLEEETHEVREAVGNGDAPEVVDGLIDVIVIALGTLELAGVDVDCAWRRVMSANMQKQRGQKPGRASDGWDLTKPPGWRAPDHGDNVGRLPNIFKGKQNG